MSLDPNLAAEIEMLRAKSREGTMSLEDMRHAIVILRSGRISAAAQSRTARKGPAAPIDAQALLDDL